MKKIYIAFISAIALMIAVQSCNVEPTYYTEVSPDNFFDSQEKVYQRFSQPFTYWAGKLNYSPLWSSFSSSSTLSCDELVMPSRNGDWYDGGYYLNHYFHQFNPADVGEWESIWNAFGGGVANVYSAINDIDANVNFTSLGFPEGTRDMMINQLNVLVAFYYLKALDNFGGVPIYDLTSTEALGRSTDQETFDFVERLLKEAIPKLPKKKSGDAENGYVTQGTAAALLAQLYFNAEPYIKKDMYAECEKVCTDIKSGVYGDYSLGKTYQEIFGFNNSKCSELMWVLPSENGKLQIDGNCLPWASHYNTGVYLNNSSFMSWNGLCLTPSQDMHGKHYRKEAGNLGGPFKLGCPYDKFEDTDLRKKNYVYLGNGEYEGMFLAGKLINPITKGACTADGSREYPKGDTIAMVDMIAQLAPDIPDDPSTPDKNEAKERYPAGRKEGSLYGEENSGVRLLKQTPIPNDEDNTLRYNSVFPVIRFTEIQYMLAECKYRKGNKAEAATLINEVRKRYFKGNDPNPVTSANLDEYRFLDEWLIEFLGEGHRRADLIRWGKYTTEAWWDHAADGPGKEYLNRFPIPATVLNANNKLVQNPGY
jgi:hypothetical protein